MPLSRHAVRRLAAPAAVLLAAGLLGGAAVFNGWPLLYPDTLEYGPKGAEAWDALRTGAAFVSARPVVYGMALPLATHPWLAVGAQAMALAFLLWLATRGVWGRPRPLAFLAVVAALAIATTAPWYASFLVPDVFAAVVILGTALLLTAPALARWERGVVIALVAFGVAVHTSHVLLGVALVVGVGAARWLGAGLRTPGLASGLAWAGAAVAGGVLLVAGVHLGLYGSPAHSPPTRPPLLVALVVLDGPGQRFLEAECPRAGFAACAWLPDPPRLLEGFLWTPESLWQRASDAERERMRREELAIVLGAARSEPGALAARVVANALRQTVTLGLDDLRPHPYLQEHAVDLYPDAIDRYRASRQHREALPLAAAAKLQAGVVALSVVALGVLGWRGRERVPPHAAAFALTVAGGVLLNPWVTGTLTEVVQRYQARVVWLLPFLALVLLPTLRTRSRVESSRVRAAGRERSG